MGLHGTGARVEYGHVGRNHVCRDGDSTRGWEEGWDRSFVLMGGAMCCWRRLMVDQGGWFEEMEEIEGVHAGAAAVGLRWVRGIQE